MKREKVGQFAVPGFLANGVCAGIKKDGKKDLALIVSEVPATAAAVFTSNLFKAAPVVLDGERIKKGKAQAILVNSGNANAGTGDKGYENALAMSRFASDKLGIRDKDILIASTGVIGMDLPVKKVGAGMSRLVRGLRSEGLADAAEAIMTTDKFPKIASRQGIIGGSEVTIAGIAKGAGMIEPNMATMLAFFMTDVAVDYRALNKLFRRAVNRTFNAISVDGCMSTNDTAIILANGLAGNGIIRGESSSAALFEDMLSGVMSELATLIVQDGEGATKLIEITVKGARERRDAKKIAYAIANSNLVKTAFFGGDPNWGRIISAIGSAGVAVTPERVNVFMGGVPIFSGGRGAVNSGKKLQEIMGLSQINVNVELGMGDREFTVLTADLSFEYVKINAHYHT
ncbi:MAG: bifunctional glutamate N-acetyltransferase/amino-acid acetyltransferase ArgJ [Deltaproteobacteria bacterium]|nr:bifunctional glutamate N-acetyltransferase/amino-acid acetyltransferase ArgJ [Deltaproteobacteria bacterium]